MIAAEKFEHYKSWRWDYFSWRQELTTLKKILLCLVVACLTGLAAQLRFDLPFTPVPVTGQTFAVLLAGIFLGRGFGGLSQIFYVAIGGLGVPWFSGSTGGMGVLFGATGGYLLGFILTAFVLGDLADRGVQMRSVRVLLPLMLACNFVLIFLPGLLGLALWYHAANGDWPTLTQVLSLGFYPFVPGAILKTALAAGVASRL